MRLFVAVDVPEGVKAQLWRQLGGLRERWPELKWVRPELLHITLKFLGEQDEELLPRIKEGLGKVRFRSFEATLEGLGSFGGRVLWVGISQGARELEELARLVRKNLSFLKFPDDKPFKPHLTLARARRGGRVPSGNLGRIEALSFKVREIVLYRSVLRPEGPQYTPLFRKSL